MKYRLLCFILLLGVVVTGCIKSTKNSPAPVFPYGTFSGQFSRYHKSSSTGKLDSAKANLTLRLNTYTFAVTGDTTTLHAGSHGTFGGNTTYILFNDSTYSPKSVKQHLNGQYVYSYDGTNLVIAASSGDTLSVDYVLKKTSN